MDKNEVKFPHSIELKHDARQAFVKIYKYLKANSPSAAVRIIGNTVIEHALLEAAKLIKDKE